MLKVHVYRRIEKRNLTRFISLRTAVRIRLLQLNPLRVKLFVYRRSMSQVDLRYSKRSEIQPRHYLTVIGGTECSSVVEQWTCKLCVAGSIPAFPIPMNCNHWNFSLTSFGSSVSRWEIYAVQVGTLDFFKLRC